MNPEKALEVLDCGAKALNSIDIHWWLSAGTALGAYRDGLSDTFLIRDTDVDVGVLGDSRYQEIKETLEVEGFTCFRTYQISGCWAQLAMLKDGIIFDIYFFIPEGDILLNLSQEGVMAKPAAMVQDMELLRVRGKEYPVPTPVESYLSLRYGDWKTEKRKSGSWANDAPNLRPWGSLWESMTPSTGGT